VCVCVFENMKAIVNRACKHEGVVRSRKTSVSICHKAMVTTTSLFSNGGGGYAHDQRS